MNVLEKIARECNFLDKYNALDADFRALLASCLSISPKERPLPKDILKHKMFQENLARYQYNAPPLAESQLLQCPLKQLYYW